MQIAKVCRRLFAVGLICLNELENEYRMYTNSFHLLVVSWPAAAATAASATVVRCCYLTMMINPSRPLAKIERQ